MAENINFISATELPEATGEEISVLCLENGEMKQKPANGLGGGEKPDMVITVTGSSNTTVNNDNYTITEGSLDAVFAAFRAGRYPIIKIRYYKNDNDAYNVVREEYDAYVSIYGEQLWVSYTTLNPNGWDNEMYSHKCYMNSNGTISNVTTKKVALTTV